MATSAFGIVMAIIQMIMSTINFVAVVRNIFVLLFCAVLLILEIYIFRFVRHFGFLLKPWGKGIMYLLVGALLFQTSGLGMIAAIVFWGLAIVFCIVSIFLPVVALPAFQGGVCGKPPPEMEMRASDVYEQDSGSGGKS